MYTWFLWFPLNVIIRIYVAFIYFCFKGIQTEIADNFCWTEFLRSSGTARLLVSAVLLISVFQTVTSIMGEMSKFSRNMCVCFHQTFRELVLAYVSYNLIKMLFLVINSRWCVSIALVTQFKIFLVLNCPRVKTWIENEHRRAFCNLNWLANQTDFSSLLN